MNRLGPLLILLVVSGLSVGFVTAAQDLLTIDATKQMSPPPPGRRPSPGSASPGHSAGLPIRLELLVPATALRPDGTMLVDFVITNVGTEPIRLPSSVKDIEKRTSVLTLWLTSDAIRSEYAKDQQTGHLFKIESVGTSAELYGRSDNPRTFIVLVPNESLRVHASSRVRLNPGRDSIAAHAELLRISNGNSEDVGTADSEVVTKTLSTSGPSVP
ncbi:MAG: hypothetical protein ABSF71_21500 [Terriglobia bacterium]